MAATGGNALFGTIFSNVSLWLALWSGLTLEQAYASLSLVDFTSTQLLSFCVVLLSGFSGGYVAALYGSGRHISQAAVAGGIGATFFIAMNLTPLNQAEPIWYLPLHIAATLVSSLAGGYFHGWRTHTLH
jgi:hypothetical protein